MLGDLHDRHQRRGPGGPVVRFTQCGSSTCCASSRAWWWSRERACSCRWSSRTGSRSSAAWRCPSLFPARAWAALLLSPATSADDPPTDGASHSWCLAVVCLAASLAACHASRSARARATRACALRRGAVEQAKAGPLSRRARHGVRRLDGAAQERGLLDAGRSASS